MRHSVDPATFAALLASESTESSAISRFRVHDGKSSTLVRVPTLLANRMCHLGQAYGSRTLSSLRPGVRIVIGSVDVEAFARDLHQLLVLVNDDALHHPVNALLALLESPPGVAGKSVAVAIEVLNEMRA